MRIAQIAPLYESVPPKLYGGTERVVSYLTEELVRLGHDVTLFASGDSQTSAVLAPQCMQSLRLDKNAVDHVSHHVLMAERIYKEAGDFDVIHSHIDYIPYPLFRRCQTPALTTLHGRLDLPDLVPLYQEFRDMPVVSISSAHREPLPWLNWQATVHHGLPENLYHFQKQPGNYLAFLGRISIEKRVDYAIEIAKLVGMPIKIAAKISDSDRLYYESIRPLFKHPLVEYVGEIGESEKQEFLGQAYALLFPIEWPEPFGIVMIEAMACGTPVIAFPFGSVPEILEHGSNGFVCHSVDEAVKAVDQVHLLDRARCRRIFEERFTVTRMAHDYLKVYRNLIENEIEFMSAG